MQEIDVRISGSWHPSSLGKGKAIEKVKETKVQGRGREWSSGQIGSKHGCCGDMASPKRYFLDNRESNMDITRVIVPDGAACSQ